MIECGNCGLLSSPGSNFCSRCGAKLGTALSSGDTTNVIPLYEEELLVVDVADDEAANITALPSGKALLIVIRGGVDRERVLLDKPVTAVGRSPESDIFLDDITVSRHHADFLITETGGVSVADQGSMNGTYVDKALIDDVHDLHPGDEVQIGKFRMLVFFNEGEAA
ncbi:MAG: FHA domain-containing protein [Propionibacteriaceae bacterium]|jgi:pSer/pThr/pTyr-binding forkhead associated (FHA) protein|nr:FHA domain-containing protein [Propionibacteriaceae bacterium]